MFLKASVKVKVIISQDVFKGECEGNGESESEVDDIFEVMDEDVFIDDARSTHAPVGCGISQGTIPGPLLFILFIKNVSNVI